MKTNPTVKQIQGEIRDAEKTILSALHRLRQRTGRRLLQIDFDWSRDHLPGDQLVAVEITIEGTPLS